MVYTIKNLEGTLAELQTEMGNGRKAQTKEASKSNASNLSSHQKRMILNDNILFGSMEPPKNLSF